MKVYKNNCLTPNEYKSMKNAKKLKFRGRRKKKGK